MSEDESLLRPTLLGSLLDVAAPQRRARAAPTSRCSSRAPSTSRATSGPLPARAPRARRCCSPAPLAPPTWRGGAARPRRLLRRQGRARGRARHAARAVARRRPATPAVPAPGPRAARAWSAASRVGWLGELHPLVARAWDLDGAGRGVRARPRRGRRARARGRPPYRDLTSYPAVRQDLARRRRPTTVAGGRGRSASCAARAASCWPTRESSTSTAASRSARAGVSLALHLDVPRARPHADRRGGRRRVRERDRRRALRDELGGELRGLTLTRPRRRRRPATPARSPRGCSTATRDFELVARDLAQRRGPPAGRPLPAPPRPARARRARPRRATATSTRRSSPTRTARRRRSSRRCASAASRVVDLSADFRLRDLARLRATGTASTARPSCFGHGVYGLPELYRDEIARAPTSSPTPAATRPRRCSALAPLARAGLHRRRRRRREVRRLGRRPRARRDTTHFVAADENVTPYGVGRHRHAPEIDQELARARRAE